MTLPAALVQHAEQHGCWTGCFGADAVVQACLHPTQPLQTILTVSCLDCLSYKIGAPAALLPAGATVHSVAHQLTQHLRKARGYDLSFSGYHARGPGFWLQGVYFAAAGLFLLDGERSRQVGSDLDLLLLGFKHQALTPPDPRMTDSRWFALHTVYVNGARPFGKVASRQDLLNSPQCRTQAQAGFKRVTLAEFLPVSQAAAAGPVRPGSAKQLRIGDVCPKCGAEVRVRGLLQGTFVGCLC